MTSDDLFSRNNLVDNIQLKVKSLKTLLTELQKPSHNYKFDPSICNDIYTYIKNVETDCQRINNQYVFPNQDYQMYNYFGNTLSNDLIKLIKKKKKIVNR